MKKFYLVTVLVLLVTMLVTPIAMADETFEIKNVEYENFVLKGEVTVPEGEYFVRIVMFLEDNCYIILSDKIENNAFEFHVFANCEYMTVAIVDRLDSFQSGCYQKYAVVEKFLK